MTTTQRELREIAAGAFVGAAIAHCAALETGPRQWAAELTPHEAADALAGSPDREAREVGLALRCLLVFPDGVTRAGTIGALEASLAYLRRDRGRAPRRVGSGNRSGHGGRCSDCRALCG